MKRKSPTIVGFLGLASIFLFIIFVYALNIAAQYANNLSLYHIIFFFNNNLVIIVMMAFFFMIAEVFDCFKLPFNLPMPLFYAMGAVFLASLIFELFRFMDSVIGKTLFSPLSWISVLLYPLLFIFVLVVEYKHILMPGLSKVRKKKGKNSKKGKKEKTWKDIGTEIKEVLYDSLIEFDQHIRGKRK